MFDPRNEIVGFFSNGRISASTEYGTRYISVQLREDNEDATLQYDDIGLLLLDPPELTSQVIKVNGKTTEDTVTIVANLWIYRTEGMKNPETFVTSVLDTIQNTIIDNHLDATNNRLYQFDYVVSIQSETKELIRKAIMLTVKQFKIR
ncbi:MAG: hypothetical protein DRP09_17460 [Candidatus Thorarchaeota archaeon]|nr:MAG: hypothetical protein DRP09_17460 [Candidatus Thorarchaeota archaeon]